MKFSPNSILDTALQADVKDLKIILYPTSGGAGLPSDWVASNEPYEFSLIDGDFIENPNRGLEEGTTDWVAPSAYAPVVIEGEETELRIPYGYFLSLAAGLMAGKIAEDDVFQAYVSERKGSDGNTYVNVTKIALNEQPLKQLTTEQAVALRELVANGFSRLRKDKDAEIKLIESII